MLFNDAEFGAPFCIQTLPAQIHLRSWALSLSLSAHDLLGRRWRSNDIDLDDNDSG